MDNTGKLGRGAREKQLKALADQRAEPLRSAARARLTRREEDASRAKATKAQVQLQQRMLRKRAHAVRTEFREVANHAGTSETRFNHSRRRPNALLRAHARGDIDDDQLAYAEEIAAVAERIKRDVDVATASLESRVDVSRYNDGSIFEGLRRVRYEWAYTRWREALPAPKGLILDMITGDPLPYSSAARIHGIGHRLAKKRLASALDLWPIHLRASLSIKSDDVERVMNRLDADHK